MGEVVALDWRGNEGAAPPLLASAVEQGVALYDLGATRGLASSLVSRQKMGKRVDALCWGCGAAHDLLGGRNTDGSALVWDIRTPGPGINFVDDACSDASNGVNGGVVCWAPASSRGDHELIASSDGHVRMWDLRRPQNPLLAWDAHAELQSSGGILALHWLDPLPSADRLLLSCATDGGIKLWSLDSLDDGGVPICIASATSSASLRHSCAAARTGGGMPVMVAACDLAQSTNTTNRLQPWYLLQDDSDDSSPSRDSLPSCQLVAGDLLPAGTVQVVAHRANRLVSLGLDHCIRLWEMQPTRASDSKSATGQAAIPPSTGDVESGVQRPHTVDAQRLAARWGQRRPQEMPSLQPISVCEASMCVACTLMLPASVPGADKTAGSGALSEQVVRVSVYFHDQLTIPSVEVTLPIEAGEDLASTEGKVMEPSDANQLLIQSEMTQAVASDSSLVHSDLRPTCDEDYLLQLLLAMLVGAQRAQACAEMERWRVPKSSALLGGPVSGRLDDDAFIASRSADGGGSRLEPVPHHGARGTSERASFAPPPRTSGVRFNASGMLAVFFNSPSPYAGLADSEAPQTYLDFQSLVQGWQLAPIVQLQRAMGGASLDSALWSAASVLSVPGGEDATVEEEMDDREDEIGEGDEDDEDGDESPALGKAGRRDPAHDVPATPLSAAQDASALVFSIGAGGATTSAQASRGKGPPRKGRSVLHGLGDAALAEIKLMEGVIPAEIDHRLAQGYLVAPRRGHTASSPSALCEHNAAVALRYGRRDLWRIWMVAACALRSHETAKVVIRLTSDYRLAGNLLSSLIAERLRHRDVQTVAVLACVAAQQYGTPTSSTPATTSVTPESRLLVATRRQDALPTSHEWSCKRCTQVYADVLLRWGLIVPLAELTKFSREPIMASSASPALLVGVINVSMVGAPVVRKNRMGSAAQQPLPLPHQHQQQEVRDQGALRGICVSPGNSTHGGRSVSSSAHDGLGLLRPHASPHAIRANPSTSSLTSVVTTGSSGPGWWYHSAQGAPLTPRGGSSAETSKQSSTYELPQVQPQPQAATARDEKRLRCRCAVCCMPVNGLSWFCGACGHGGHLACMQLWMSNAESGIQECVDDAACEHAGTCPMGCGCRCMEAQPMVFDEIVNTPSAGGSTPKKRTSGSGEDGSQKGALGPMPHAGAATSRSKRVAIESLFSGGPMDSFRKDYRNFRLGKAKGAKGEVGAAAPNAASSVATFERAPRHRRTGSTDASMRGARGSSSMLDLTVLREHV